MPISGMTSAAVDPVASLVSALNAATAALTAASSSALQKSSNLSDLANAGTARTNLGLGSAAVMSTAEIAADSALTGTYAALQRQGPLVVTGDSITARNSSTLTAGLSNADSWATHLALESNGTLNLRSNAGHGGYTSTQLQALFAAEVLALNPAVVGIMVGTNDTLDSNDRPTTTAANITAMVAAARAQGASVFLCTIPPQGTAALSTPSAPTVTTATSGGTLTTATYSYRVTAANFAGTTLASSAATVVTTGSTSTNTIYAPHVEGATIYRLYGRTGGSELLIATNQISGVQSVASRVFTDTGSVTPSGALPASNTTAVAVNATYTQKITTINAWIRRYASVSGVPLVDHYALLTDPLTGMYNTGWTADGTHPSPTASRRMGSLAWTNLSSWFLSEPSPTSTSNVDPINLQSNGCFGTGTGSLPTGWNSSSGSGNFTDTRGTVSGFAGYGFTAALTAPDTRFHGATAIGGTPWSSGDKLLVAARVATTGCEAGGMNVDLRLREFAGNTTLCELYLSAADVSGVWLTEVTAPATNNVAFQLNLAYGVGSCTIGEMTIYNLTTLGLATL